MSLSAAGVWTVGVWDQTVWAEGVWREGVSASVTKGGGTSKRIPMYAEIDGEIIFVTDNAHANALRAEAAKNRPPPDPPEPERRAVLRMTPENESLIKKFTKRPH